MATLLITDTNWHTLEVEYSGGSIHRTPAGYQYVGFDDSAWTSPAVAGHSVGAWHAITGASYLDGDGYTTNHVADAIWLARREFTLSGGLTGDPTLEWNADGGIGGIWINGHLAVAASSSDYTTSATLTIPRGYFVAGLNCMAVSVNNGGAGATWTINPTMFQAKLTGTVVAAKAGVFVDWENDGFEATTADEVSTNVMSWTITRGAAAEITGGSQPGSATLTLKNPADVYNPRNAGGALYGLLRDGAAVWVGPNVDGAVAGSNPRGLFGGRVADITLIPAGGATVSPTVEITCEDMLGSAQRTPVFLDYAEGRSHRELRAAVLDAAGETRYVLDWERHTMPLSHAEGELGTVLDEINAVTGTRHLAKPTNHYLDWFRYTTVERRHGLQGVADADLDAAADHVTDTSGWRLSADTVTNQQKATITPIKFTPATFTVWEADTLPFNVTDVRPYTRFVDFDDVVAGSSLDIAYTGDTITSTYTPFASGGKIEFTVAAGDSAKVTGLSIEGRLARRLEQQSYVSDDTTSQAAPRGIRAGSEIGNEYLGVMATATGIARHVTWRYGNPQLRPTLTVQNWLPDQFDLDLYDVISFTSTQLGMADVLFEIVGLTHESDFAASASGHLHTVTYVLQECRVQTPTTWFTLGSSLIGGADLLAH